MTNRGVSPRGWQPFATILVGFGGLGVLAFLMVIEPF
jgi:hypothetical protein